MGGNREGKKNNTQVGERNLKNNEKKQNGKEGKEHNKTRRKRKKIKTVVQNRRTS